MASIGPMSMRAHNRDAYEARYIKHNVQDPGPYIVRLNDPGYTMTQHLAYLTWPFELEYDVVDTEPGKPKGYTAVLADSYLEMVRSDPRVDYVEDDTSNIDETQTNAGGYLAPYSGNTEREDGLYAVLFNSLEYTVAQHIAFVGREFKLTAIVQGYFARLSKELFDAVRRDPNVAGIEDG